jgi:hypothetical protein
VFPIGISAHYLAAVLLSLLTICARPFRGDLVTCTLALIPSDLLYEKRSRGWFDRFCY